MKITIADPARFQISADGVLLTTVPPEMQSVNDEKVDSLPVLDPAHLTWNSGAHLHAMEASGCTQSGAYVPNSLRMKTLSGTELNAGTDFIVNDFFGRVGRAENSSIGENETVVVSYSFYPSRIDSVVRLADGKIVLIQGKNGMADPALPELPQDAERLANILFFGKVDSLTDDMLFPVLEKSFPADLLPSFPKPERAIAKLKSGEKLRILAWGDSVTEGRYLPEYFHWQNQFVRSLKERYPQADIELITAGWDGHTTSAFYQEPPDSLHNYEKTVLGPKPDLVISEFVNDAGFPQEQLTANYGKAKHDFEQIGAEWIIIAPHYIRRDWMGLTSQHDCDDDPRPYVKFLRNFSAENHIPLADAARIWGRLYRQGIPYETLFVNGINHPNNQSMGYFRDALMALF